MIAAPRRSLLLAPVIAWLAADGVRAQFAFVDRTDLLASPELASAEFSSGVPMGVVDMNGDGRDDLVRLHQRQFLSIELQGAPGQPFVHSWVGLLSAGNWGEVWSLAAADLDRDGRNDLLFGRTLAGMELLTASRDSFAGPGEPLFTSTVLENRDIYPQGMAFADIDNDGRADLFACHDFGRNQTYRNTGDGFLRFDDGLMGGDTALLSHEGNYATIWTDYDNDGDLDLYLSKCKEDQGPTSLGVINQLWRNEGDGTFTEDAAAAGLKDGGQTWCSDFADIDNDGDLDCLIMNHGIRRTRLLENDGAGVYTDISESAGLGDELVFFGIQALFRDFDNDGFVDLLITSSDLGDATPMVLTYRNQGDQTFARVEQVFTESTGVGLNYLRSCAIGDLNHDGFLDVYGGRGGSFNEAGIEGDRLFLNVPNGNNWLAVQLAGTESNPNGIGARVEAHGPWGVQVREVRAGEGYGIMNTFTQHIGLGSATEVERLVVRWPSGLVDELDAVASGQFLEVVEGSTVDPAATAAPVIEAEEPFSALVGHVFERTIEVAGIATRFELVGARPAGMEIDPVLGIVRWTPEAPGTFAFTVRAANPAGSATMEFQLEGLADTLGHALDAPDLVFTTGGDAPWITQQEVSADGFHAAQSHLAESDGTAWLETTIQGPDLLLFDWRSSAVSFSNWLTVRLDGETAGSLTGETGWTGQAVSIPPGRHVVRWTQEAVHAPLSGRRAGWVDRVRLASQLPEPHLRNPARVSGEKGRPFSFALSSSQAVTRYEAEALPGGLLLDGQSGVISGTPTVGGTFAVTVRAVGADQRIATQELQIQLAEGLAEGIDTEGGLVWTTGGDRVWTRRTGEVPEDGDWLEVSGFDGLESSWLSTEVEGPDVLEFLWMAERPNRALTIEMDGVTIVESGPFAFSWERRILSIPPGRHEIRWIVAIRPGRAPAEVVARLDEVKLASTADSPIFVTGPYPAAILAVRGKPFAWQIPLANRATLNARDPLPAGLVLEPDGRLTGSATESGFWTVGIAATSPTGQEASIEQPILVVEPVGDDLGEALDWPGLVWGWTGEAPWQFESGVTGDGSDSARSGPVGREDRSILSTVVTGPGTVSFRWKISADRDDELRFSIDGMKRAEISGETDWQAVSEAIPPGDHVLAWGFDREDGAPEGLDAAFLDQLVLTGYAGWIAARQPADRRSYALDDDGDGSNQLLEYAFGLSATEPDPPPPLALAIEDGFPVVAIERPRDSTGLHYVLECSLTLEPGSWTREGTEILRDTADVFRARVTAPGRRQFVRVRVVTLP